VVATPITSEQGGIHLFIFFRERSGSENPREVYEKSQISYLDLISAFHGYRCFYFLGELLAKILGSRTKFTSKSSRDKGSSWEAVSTTIPTRGGLKGSFKIQAQSRHTGLVSTTIPTRGGLKVDTFIRD
jgi:hypothetical protein